jgi:hypothetical protein
VNVQVRSLGKPAADQFGLVARWVVHDDVQVETRGHVALDCALTTITRNPYRKEVDVDPLVEIWPKDASAHRDLQRDGNPNRRVIITVGPRSSFHCAYRDPSAYDSIQRVLESFQLEGGSRRQRQRQRDANAVDPALHKVDDAFLFVKQALPTLCRVRVGPILTYS